MKKLTYIILLLFWLFYSGVEAGNLIIKKVVVSGGPVKIAEDNFDGGTDSQDLNGVDWLQLNAGWNKIQYHNPAGEGEIKPSHDNVTNQGAVVWIGTGVFTVDQYAKIRMTSLPYQGFNYFGGVTCRSSTDTGANRDYYGVYVAADSSGSPYGCKLQKTLNGVVSDLVEGTLTISEGDMLEIRCTGINPTQLRVFVNGVENTDGFSYDDVTDDLETGSPGITGSGTANTPGMDDWEAGNL